MGEELSCATEPQVELALEAHRLAKAAEEAGRIIITARSSETRNTLIQVEDNSFAYHETDINGRDTLTLGASIASVYRRSGLLRRRRLLNFDYPEEIRPGDRVFIDFAPDTSLNPKCNLSTYMDRVTFINRPKPKTE
jgi:hypothetical protein